MVKWALLLVLGVAIATTPSPPPGTLSYKEAVSRAVGLYNQRAAGDSHFRLLRADSPSGWDGNSPGVRELHFLVKETVCLGSERAAMEECDFKEDGRVRRCSGYVSSEQWPATILITCDPAAEAPARVRRASCGRPYKTRRQPTRHVRRHHRMTAGRK
uniref:Cathelicidin-like peptide 2 n=1 Tax=Pelodiscus sinensis TaxID=13735 RepID=K7GIB1_PELSI|nr:cathelicidin-related peptide Bf-CRAMP-like [Pelodiscus sinensis]AWW22371.1 cathelicidin-like peptide 2 [Pelodiscus sinensis]|eukprot:XP_006114480.1 cathelicidin-related peptide Bf-CRAMP-like [Pelodiscus sinensis]